MHHLYDFYLLHNYIHVLFPGKAIQDFIAQKFKAAPSLHHQSTDENFHVVFQFPLSEINDCLKDTPMLASETEITGLWSQI